ncbi:ADP-ribose pyrophosphatase YjhB, NUDIX family [Pedobacter antarcticus]|nr:ADP-ribose pyrophosphatase YjhB, NUDIX family [Pedobacter antarcticus]
MSIFVFPTICDYMKEYVNQPHYLVAVDCIVFGFDDGQLKILLVKRGLEPEINKWSLMGGFVGAEETPDEAANRVLKKLTGLEGVYLELLNIYGEPDRDPIERTLSVGYFALIDIHKYETQLIDNYHAEWFPINEIPKLIFDHNRMVAEARKKLKFKASLHPILFEMLPKKFTIPQLQTLFEQVNDTKMDTGNFSRKVTSTGLLIRLEEKDKSNSKKGAYYFKLNKKSYAESFNDLLSL